MDVLVEQPAIHGVGNSTETHRHWDYVSPDTDLHSCPPIFSIGGRWSQGVMKSKAEN